MPIGNCFRMNLYISIHCTESTTAAGHRLSPQHGQHFLISDLSLMRIGTSSVYNTIIGRETLHALRAVASTYHMLLKFPTPKGIGVVDGAQTVSRETYELATAARSRRMESPSTKQRSPGECLQVGTMDHVDYGVITGAIQLGNLDPRDDFY